MTDIIVLITVLALFIAKYKMPESIRWLEKNGKKDEAFQQIQKYFGLEANASVASKPVDIKQKDVPI
jgi:hypothetical protein